MAGRDGGAVFFHVLGIAAAAWLGVGALVGLAFVGTRPAMFFSAGFHWGAMARTALLAIPYWPAVLHQIVRGDREDEARYERDRANESRRARETYRFQLRQGAWYRDVLGSMRKWHTDGFGRHYDPDLVGPEAERIREPDFACNAGEWTEGACPLCGAPEKGASVCGMLRTEFVGVPQYTPPARPMRHAPEEGYVLAVSNGDLGHGSFIDRQHDRFHEVAFARTAPGKGRWLNRRGEAVEGLFGWWPLPGMDATQSSDGLETPHRWTGEEPPEAYDSAKAWDAAMGRPGGAAA